MALGAPGKPGSDVLNAATSDHSERPTELTAATRNLYAVPGSKLTLTAGEHEPLERGFGRFGGLSDFYSFH